MMSPLLTSFPISAACFSSYEAYMRYMKIENRKEKLYTHCNDKISFIYTRDPRRGFFRRLLRVYHSSNRIGKM